MRSIHRDERRLLVAIRARKLQIDVLVAHAPCDPRAKDLVASVLCRQWWAETRRILAARPRPADLLILGDFNARLGSVQSAAVGDVGAELEISRRAIMYS